MKSQDFIKNNKRNIIVSFIVSIFLLFAGYYGNNMPLFTGENLVLLAIMETVNGWFGLNQEEDDDYIFINTSYDKSLIKYYQIDNVEDPHPMFMGNTEITDRVKLIKLLRLLKDIDYKYLVIDIRFVKGLECDSCFYDSIDGKIKKVDEVLFSLINQLDRVVVATHHNVKLINKELEKKAALADYWKTATSTNFVRYEYFDSIPYIPLAVYNDLNKRSNRDTIACHIPFGVSWLKQFAYYTQGCNLCYNSLFLDFKIFNKNHAFVNEYGFPVLRDIDYMNMSQQILDINKRIDGIRDAILGRCKGKYVFIGNFTEDIHDTYAGPQPGCVILYNALKALDDQKHIVSNIELFFLFFLYFFMSLFILKGLNLLDFLKKTNNSLLNFMADTVSFTFIFTVVQIIEYIYGRTSFSFIIPILFFSVMKTWILLNTKYKI